MSRNPLRRLIMTMMTLLITSCGPTTTRVASPTPTPTIKSDISSDGALTPEATSTMSPVVTLQQPIQLRATTVKPSAADERDVEVEIGTPSTPNPERQAVSKMATRSDVVTLTIVYDNNAHDPALETAWGFACVVQTTEATVLFDTGGDGPTLLGNMAKLGLDPRTVDVIVLSHVHGDHVGGLVGLLNAGASPIVYVPAAFPESFKESVRARTALVEVTDSIEVSTGIHTTGPVGSAIIEQALVVETGAGLIIITGCAHPGIVEMVRRAHDVVAGKVNLAIGGFHLGEATPGQIEGIIADLERLGVEQPAPCHCTGDRARRMFAEAFGAECILAGAGQVIVAGPDKVQAK